MTTTIYTKGGIIQYIQSDGMSIPADEKNRDYRKVMAQDAITPFERVEIVYPEPIIGPTTEERLATLEAAIATDPSIQEQIDAIVELLNAGGT